MFAAKTTIFLALLALCNIAVAAIPPPACLLAAVNQQDKPSDMSTICGGKSNDVQHTIQDLCGDDTKAALKAYSKTCSENGKTVSLIETGNGNGNGNGNGDSGNGTSGKSSATGTSGSSGSITSTNTVGTASSTATQSGGATAQPTGAASSNKVGSAVAAVAVAAFAVAL